MDGFGVNMLWVALRDYLPSKMLGPHLHPDGVYHYIYVLQGGGGIRIGEKYFDFAPGMMYLTAPEVPHDFFSSEDAPLLTIEFKFTVPDRELDEQCRSLPLCVDCRSGALQKLVTGMWRETERKRYRYEQMLAAQSYEMLYLLQRAEQEGAFCHGAYKGESLRVLQDGSLCIGGFDQCEAELPLADLAAYLRRYMKKTEGRREGVTAMIQAFEKHYPLSEKDFLLLQGILLYPEKFLRLINEYYNRRRACISPAMEERLQTAAQDHSGLKLKGILSSL